MNENANIIIKPTELQTEIDRYKSANDTIKGLKYDVSISNTVLTSIDKVLECVTEMNEILTKFSALSDDDIHNLEMLQTKWMQLDTALAGKTIGDRVMDMITPSSN